MFCSQVRQDFFDLVSEQHIEGGQRWSKVKERLETDPRYKAVESSALREELFKQYMEKQAKVGALLCAHLLIVSMLLGKKKKHSSTQL